MNKIRILNTNPKNYILFLIILFSFGCFIKQGIYSNEEVEEIRIQFKEGKRKALFTLIEIYRDKNQPYEIRKEALQALGESRLPIVIDQLQSSVSKASLIELDMMLQAIDIVVAFDDENSTDSLISSLKATESKVMEIRESIINGIGASGNETEIITLLELYEVSKSNHARMNKLLTLTLGSMGDDRAIPILMEIAQDQDMEISIRNRAVEILSRKQAPELIDFFVEMLGEPNTRDKVNEYALNVLSSDLQNNQMLFALLEAYQTGKHQYFSLLNSLINGLEDYENPGVKDIFLDIATTDGFPKVIRLKAFQSLTKFDDDDIGPSLIKILNKPSNYIYYDEIMLILQKSKSYDNYKNKIRLAAYEAMLEDIKNITDE